MDELSPPVSAVTDDRPRLDPKAARTATLPLLAGYLAFGQFWASG
jgi:hypothetical protein